MRAAITGSRRDGLAITAGIAVSDLSWAVAALTGFSALFTHFAWLSIWLRVLGGGYLVYLGVQTWRYPAKAEVQAPNLGHGCWNSARTGLLTNLANPKSLVFFGSIFAATLPAGAPIWVWAAIGGIIVVNAVWWHSTLAIVFTMEPARRAYRHVKTGSDRVLGAALTSAGVYFLATAHT